MPYEHATKLIQNGINNFEKESISLQIKHAVVNSDGKNRSSTKLLRVNAHCKNCTNDSKCKYTITLDLIPTDNMLDYVNLKCERFNEHDHSIKKELVKIVKSKKEAKVLPFQNITSLTNNTLPNINQNNFNVPSTSQTNDIFSEVAYDSTELIGEGSC